MKKYLYLVIVIALAAILSLPVLHDGLFNVYDNVQVTRVAAVADELRSGQFPVRYMSEMGYGAGYMLFKYYSLLIYYLGASFTLVGATAIQAVKLVYLSFILVGAIGSYVFLRMMTGSKAAIIGTAIFLSSPYLFHDLYHRGSLTEASALLLIPWVLYFYFALIRKPSTSNLIGNSLGLASVMLTHTLTGVMAWGAVLLHAVIDYRQIKNPKKLLLSLLLAIGLSSFNLIPAIFERGEIRYEESNLALTGYIDHPVPITQQLENQGENGEKSAYLGITLVAVLAILITIVIKRKTAYAEHNYEIIWIVLIAGIGLILMDPLSSFAWASLAPIRYLQFPFRMLAILTPILCLGAAIIAHTVKKKWLVVIATILFVGLPLYMERDYYQTLGYQYGTVYTIDDPCKTTTWSDEYLSKWTNKCLRNTPQLARAIDGEVVVASATSTNNGRQIEINTIGTGKVIIGRYYTKEWKAYTSEGEAVEISPYGENGLISLSVSGDNDRTIIHLGKTTQEVIGDWVSLSTVILLITLGVLSKYFDKR